MGSSKAFTCDVTYFNHQEAKMKTTFFLILIVALMTADALPFGIPQIERAWKEQIRCWSSNCWSWLIDWKPGNYKSWNKCCCFRFENKIGSPSLSFYFPAVTQSQSLGKIENEKFKSEK